MIQRPTNTQTSPDVSYRIDGRNIPFPKNRIVDINIIPFLGHTNGSLGDVIESYDQSLEMFCPSAMHDGSPFWRPGAFGALTTTNTGPQLAFRASESERTLDRRVARWKLRFLFLTTRWSGKKGVRLETMGKVWLNHVENTFVAVTGGDNKSPTLQSYFVKTRPVWGFTSSKGMWRTWEDNRSIWWDVYRWITPFFVVNAGKYSIMLSMWDIYTVNIYIYTRMVSIDSIKIWSLYKMSWNHVSIRLDVSNMHLFWCKLSWMGPWAFHRIASSEDIPRQGPHPSGTLENNRLCPLTDCWQHASHFLKHLELLAKNHQVKTKRSVYGFLNSALMEKKHIIYYNILDSTHTDHSGNYTYNVQQRTIHSPPFKTNIIHGWMVEIEPSWFWTPTIFHKLTSMCWMIVGA